MKKKLKLSIVLLTYNRFKSGYLKQALDAILGQTYSDFELIVMDNYSSDKTSELVLSYNDPRLTYVRQPPGGNGSTNYTKGLWISQGEYVLLTHDDDIMEPTMVEKQIALIKKYPKLMCVATNVSLIDEKGNTIQSRLYNLDEDIIFRNGNYIPTYLEEKLWLPTPTLLMKRNTHMKVTPEIYKTEKLEYKPSGDIQLMFLLNLMGPIAIISEPLLRYRQHPGQESRNVNQSAPLLDMSKSLLTLAKKSKKAARYLPSIFGAFIRFKTQDVLFTTAQSYTKKKLIKKIGLLKKKWEEKIPSHKRAVDVILPFEIFSIQLGFKPSIPKSKLKLLNNKKAFGGARLGYRNWLNALLNRNNLFSSKPKIKRIAIFGSMFTSFLIVQDAINSGIEVVCCLDTSKARIGENILGVPIVNLKELRKTENKIDAIITSSERDHENALKEILISNMKVKKTPIYSWKQLAKNASKL